MGLRFAANTRETKLMLRYDGHDRHAGSPDKAMRWRRLRRRFARWMLMAKEKR